MQQILYGMCAFGIAIVLLLAGTDSVTSLVCFGASIVGTTLLYTVRQAYGRRPPYVAFGPPVHLLPKINWRRWLFCAAVILAVGLFAWRWWAGVTYARNGRPYMFQGAYLAAPLIYAAWWMYRLGWHLSTPDRLHDLAHKANNGFRSMTVHAAFMGGHHEELARSALHAINCLEAASCVPGAHGVNNLARAEAANWAIQHVLARNTPANVDQWVDESARIQVWLANEIDRHHSYTRDVATTSH